MPSVLGAFNQIFHRKDKSKSLINNEPKARPRRQKPVGTTIRCYPMRLADGVELVASIEELMRDVQLPSLILINAMGHVSAGRVNKKEFQQRKNCSIVSLQGSFAGEEFHLIGSLWDEENEKLWCGEITSLTISRSCEILLAEPMDLHLHRYIDPQSGQNLLFVQKKSTVDL